MDWPDNLPRNGHTCTFQELRFGTCTCHRRAMTQPVVVASTSSGFPKQTGDDRGWVADLRDQREVQLKVELKPGLDRLPSGERIRLLRKVLEWSQERAARELGISRRTLIRHEQGKHRHPWMRLSLLVRLRQVESDHEEQLVSYLARVES